MDEAEDNAGVIFPPPFIFLTILMVGLILDWILPLATDLGNAGLMALGGGVLIAAGLAIMLTSVRNFTRAGTTLPPNQAVTALVTDGLHGYSRNPIYVGMTILYLGFGIALQSVWTFIFVVPLLLIMRYGVIAREESYLERKFGQVYLDYKASVRRWI